MLGNGLDPVNMTSTPATSLNFLQGSGSADELLTRCQALWTDIEAFRDALKRRQREQTVELSHYRGIVRSELKSLERLAQRQQDAKKQRIPQPERDQKLAGEANGHAVEPTDTSAFGHEDDTQDEDDLTASKQIASSNLPFLESVWNSAKSATGLVALQKRFFYGESVERSSLPRGVKFRRRRGSQSHLVKTGKALIDVVADNGLEWIKVSLVTNHRMIMDKAREGWAEGDSSSEEDHSDEDGIKLPSDDPDGDIPIVKIGESMLEASRETRIRTKYPTVRMILPKIVEGEQPQIDKIIARLRSKGIVVECSPNSILPRPLDSVLDRMITNPFVNFTDTLNIDCTILLGLVSDFSHSEVVSEPWFHRALKRQIEIENHESLLPNVLYPALAGRRLVCTAEAAKRMMEIVDTIATPDERDRTEIFIGKPGQQYTDEEQRKRREKLAKCSKVAVPDDLQLPILIVEKETGKEDQLPAVASTVKETLSPINRSVFMYGWSAGFTTVTSNRTVVKAIETVLEQHASSEQDWPLRDAV
ncbi:UPF0415 protein [Sphaceloma murrayae]|uniref:UPF0415 protein n=1 Tax=Sphaceloma murrayae TaxID=2082308 RepID=A0A2K1QR97_9PEZI|nr:UPF0415 protein [Sphaceloma murrayae]